MPYYPGYDGQRGFWDGVLAVECRNILRLLYSEDIEDAYRRMNHVFPSVRYYLRFHANKTVARTGAWDALCDRLHKLSDSLLSNHRDLLEGNLVVQTEMLRALYYGTYHLARAALARLDGEAEKAIAQLERARDRIETGWTYCVNNGNRGIYKGWYTMANILDMDLLKAIAVVLNKLQGNDPFEVARREWIDRFFTIPEKEKIT